VVRQGLKAHYITVRDLAATKKRKIRMRIKVMKRIKSSRKSKSRIVR